MSNYPVWWDTTVTIYNKFVDPQTQVVTWHRTVVENCFYKNIGNKVTIDKAVIETNNIICRIPKNNYFLQKYLWDATPNDMMSRFFTLALGDIIVVGEVTDEIQEYVKGHRSTDLITKYKSLQGCMRIEEVSINIGAGRCNEHYLVKGV